MKSKNKIAFYNFLSNILLRGISVFTAPVFSRLLGTSGYGVLSVYNIWARVGAVTIPLQTQGTLANARLEYPEEDQKKYQSSVMSLSVLCFLVFGAMMVPFGGSVASALRLPRILIPLMLLHSFGSFVTSFMGNKFTYEFKAGKNFALSAGTTLATVAVSLALVLSFPQESRYMGRILGNGLVYGILGIVFCCFILWNGKTLWNPGYWKFCLSLCLPLVFYNLSDLILSQSDQVMLQQLLDNSSVGMYGLAYTFCNVLFTIFHSLNNTWVPFFFDDIKNGARDQLKSSARTFLELFTVLSMGFVLLAPEVFRLYAGRDFWDGASLIPLFATGYYLNFLCTFPVNYEYSRKKTKAVAAITVSCSLANLALNYVLILRCGMLGAALATTISHGLQLLLHYGYTRYFLGKGDYPFGIRMWAGHLAVYLLSVGGVFLIQKAWFLRWGVGAALGIWELTRIRKRRSLL